MALDIYYLYSREEWPPFSETVHTNQMINNFFFFCFLCSDLRGEENMKLGGYGWGTGRNVIKIYSMRLSKNKKSI